MLVIELVLEVEALDCDGAKAFGDVLYASTLPSSAYSRWDLGQEIV